MSTQASPSLDWLRTSPMSNRIEVLQKRIANQTPAQIQAGKAALAAYWRDLDDAERNGQPECSRRLAACPARCPLRCARRATPVI